MIVITGTVKNGQVVLDEPASLPEGARVEVVPVGSRPLRPDAEDDPMTPEEIQAVLDAMARIEPLVMTPEEEADLADWRAKRKELEIADWDRRSRRIEEMFE